MLNKRTHTSKKLKIVACIQARMGSKRLKKKALLKIRNKTIIQIIIDRLKKSKEVDDIILCTCDTKENDILAEHAKSIGLKCYRGSESDLISRHLGAVQKMKADAILKITADCPLADSKLVDRISAFYRKNYKKFDFITNCFPPTYPDGLDINIVPTRVLEKLDKEIKNPLYREYFVTYIMENPGKFRIYNFRNSKDISYLRWTLDYPEDLNVIKKIFGYFKKEEGFFMADILKLIKKNPGISKINEGRVDKVIIRNIRSGVYHEEIKKIKKQKHEPR